MQTTTPAAEVQRLRNDLKSIKGYIERDEKQRALGVIKKALNESEPRSTKKRPV